MWAKLYHSTVLIQADGLNILTDPIFSERCSPVSWAGPKRVRNPGVSFDKLPPVDVILISHDHYDHLDLATVEKLVARDNPLIFMGLGVGRHLSLMKDARIVEMDWWEESHLLPGLNLHFVPVQHFSGRTLTDRNATLWGGYVFEVANKKIYFGGDTGYASHFSETSAKFGGMDIAILPIGSYEPRDFMSYAHINPAEAVQAHLDLRAKNSIGVHYGTFQLTAEKIDDPIRHLHEALLQRGVSAEKFLTPAFGQVIEF